MSVIPQLASLYNKYRCKSCPREYNRIMSFSKLIEENYQEQLYAHYLSTLKWLDTTFLKNIDIFRIVSEFNALNSGIPKIHDTAKRFGDCLKVWLACNWNVYSHLLLNAKRENSNEDSNQFYINIYLDKYQIASLKTLTGYEFKSNYQIFVHRKAKLSIKSGILQFRPEPYVNYLDINLLLNHRTVITV